MATLTLLGNLKGEGANDASIAPIIAAGTETVAALDTKNAELVADEDSAVAGALSANFLPGDKTGVAEGQVPVWSAAASKFLPGDAVDPALTDTVEQLTENTQTLEESSFSTVISNGTVSATLTQTIHVAAYDSMLEQVSFAFSGAVAQSDTNYWTIKVSRYRYGIESVIATKTTKVTGGQAITAFTDWNFDLLVFADPGLLKGDLLVVKATPTGTPSNLVAPVVTFRAPAADVAFVPPPTTLFEDTFVRADNAALGTSSSGTAWDTSTNWRITSNAATSTGVGNAVVETNDADVTIEYTIGTATASVGAIFRYTDTSNYWGVTDAIIFKRVAGAVTNLGAGWTPTLTAGDVVRVVLNGSTISIYAQRGGTGTFDLLYTTTDAFNQTATKHGMRASVTGLKITHYKVSSS